MKPKLLSSKLAVFVPLVGIGLIALPASADITIYSDNFDGIGLSLNGSSVDVGNQNWQAGGAFLDNGAVNTVVGTAVGNAAFLPFSPLSGTVYTASATIVNPYGDWIGFGFFSALPVNGGDWTGTTFGQRHSNSGYAWLLDRNLAGQSDQQAFLGYGTGNSIGAINGDLFDSSAPLTISIVLDTTTANWSAEFILNGNSQGVFSFPSADNPGIGGIGFSRTSNGSSGTGGTISGFTLTQVPEPSALALLGLSWMGTLLFRRHKK